MNHILKFFIPIAFVFATFAHAWGTEEYNAPQDNKTNKLKELVVESSNIRQEGDKTFITITKSMRKGSVTTEQLLGNIPGFFYEPNIGIRYNNSDNFVLMVDSVEKPKSLIYELNNLKFDRIVIVRQPQGQYAGYDYLINLHKREHYQGYEGNLYALYNQYLNNKSRHGVAAFRPSGYYYMSYDKLTLHASAYLNHWRNGYNTWGGEDFIFDRSSQKIIPNAEGWNSRSRANIAGGSLMADYQFAPQIDLSFQYSYGHTPYHSRENKTLQIVAHGNPDPEITPFLSETDSYNNRHTATLFYLNNAPKVKYNGSVQYTFSNDNRSSHVMQGETSDFHYHFRDRMNLVNINLNGYTYLNNRTSLGWGYTGVIKDYSRDDYATGGELSSNSFLRNKIFAGVTQSFGKGFMFSAAPFIEFITQKWKGVSYHTTPFGANAFLTWNFSRRDWARIDYSAYAVYPDQNMVSDWGTFSQPLVWTGGNPALKSGMWHNITLQINLFNALNLRTGYQANPSSIATIGQLAEGALPDGTTGQYLAYKPYNGNYRSYYVQASFSRWLSRSFSVNSFFKYSHTYVSAEDFSNSANFFGFDFSTRYFNRQHGFNVWFTYVLQRYKTPAPQSLSTNKVENPYITLTKFLCNNKVELKFVLGDFFHIFGECYKGTSALIPGVYTSDYRTPDWQTNKIEFSFTYRFWGGKSIKAYMKSMSEEK